MRVFKAIFASIAVVAALCVIIVPISAEEGTKLPEQEWEGFADSLPEDIKEYLPNGTLEGEEGFFEDVSEMSRGSYVINVILDITGVELGGALKLFFVLSALILLSAVFSAFCEGMSNSALSGAVRFCSVGALISAIIYTQYTHFSLLESLFEKIGGVMGGIIPVIASIWAMGGNVSTASVGSASFGVMLGASQGIFASTLVPVCCVLTVFGFCDSLSDEMKTGKIAATIKKIYVFVLVLVMTVLLSSLGAQTALAASADTTAARAARLVSGTVIPVLGGSVGETFRSVAAGVTYLKSVFGIGSIIVIALLVLPVVISILLTRMVFLICGGLADMLGCSGEARLLESLGEVYGFMLAVVSGVSVMFVLALYIFMQTVVAVA